MRTAPESWNLPSKKPSSCCAKTVCPDCRKIVGRYDREMLVLERLGFELVSRGRSMRPWRPVGKRSERVDPSAKDVVLVGTAERLEAHAERSVRVSAPRCQRLIGELYSKSLIECMTRGDLAGKDPRSLTVVGVIYVGQEVHSRKGFDLYGCLQRPERCGA
jgi:hypothetical protein